jgi:hypothetical protein
MVVMSPRGAGMFTVLGDPGIHLVDGQVTGS